MVPSKEMLDAYFHELSHADRGYEEMWYFAGVAAYAFLASPSANEWKVKHGFKTYEQEEYGENDDNLE
jgi:hypothetical protein